MKLKHGIQKQIKHSTQLSSGYINDILWGRQKLTSYPTAKKLAAATNTDPILWLEADAVSIRAALNSKHNNNQNNVRGQNGTERD